MLRGNRPASPVNLPTSPLSKLAGALRYADFRVLWVSTLANQMGQGMQQVVLGWLVLEMTGSAGMVGVVFAMRSAPNLLVGLVAGSITDRMDRCLVMRGSILGMTVLSAGSAAALYTGAITVWFLMAVAFSMGICHTFYMTARMVYVYDIVGSGSAMQGIAIISLAQRSGGVLGALVAGGAIHWWGPGAAFAVMGGGYAVGGLALLWLKEAGQSAPQEREPILENIHNYFSALRTNREMLVLIVTTGAADFLGFSHHALLPVLAKDVLHVGPSWLGVLTAFRFLGGALGVVVSAALERGQAARADASGHPSAVRCRGDIPVSSHSHVDCPAVHYFHKHNGLGDRHSAPKPAATQRAQRAARAGHGFMAGRHGRRAAGATADRIRGRGHKFQGSPTSQRRHAGGVRGGHGGGRSPFEAADRLQDVSR